MAHMKTNDGQITLSSNMPDLATGEENLIVQAARLLQESFGIKDFYLG